ncbi:MAG TPA: transporter [Vicinamibacteria bacterium]|nr:transporter [Vicinamibacteria bacterium]
MLAAPAVARAQAAAPAPAPAPGISDNSFLLEEAYNQEFGVVQHISALTRFGPSDWIYTFTQEWPVPGPRHQLSVTVPLQGVAGAHGLGDVAINYRYQVRDKNGIACAPRLSLLVPTGSSSKGLGAGGVGLQTNGAVSIALGKAAVAHENLGATWIPRARDDAGDRARSLGFNAGQSVIWLVRPTFNALAELAWTRVQDVVGPGRTARRDTLYLSPGVRWAYNFASGLQIVPGLAVPIGIGPSKGDTGVFLYLSFEHPFRRAK